MIFYLPERIYDKVKTDKNYIDLLTKYETHMAKISSIEELLQDDSSESSNKDIFIAMDNFIKAILKDDPILLTEYKICNGEYTEKELEDFYTNKPKEIDTESEFFCLSNILNTCYQTSEDKDTVFNNYTKWIEEYKTKYESISDEEKSFLSKYVHLKYMYAYIWNSAYELKDYTEDDLAEKMYNHFCYQLIAIQSKVNDKDIIYNYFIEAVCDALQLVMDKNPEQVKKVISKIDELLFPTNYQYKSVSYGELKFMTIRLLNSILYGDYTDAFCQESRIYKFLNNAFSNEKTLLRGLGYYDKSNWTMFCVYVRFNLKLTEIIPVFSNFTLTTISDKDKEYILSDRLAEVKIKDPNRIPDTNTKLSLDQLIEFLKVHPNVQKLASVRMG